jgi:hypothetical protein
MPEIALLELVRRILREKQDSEWGGTRVYVRMKGKAINEFGKSAPLRGMAG